MGLWQSVSSKSLGIVSATRGASHLQAITVIHEPAVAPAAPKQAIEDRFGYVPFLLTWARTSMPKFFLSQAEYAYLDRW